MGGGPTTNVLSVLYPRAEEAGLVDGKLPVSVVVVVVEEFFHQLGFPFLCGTTADAGSPKKGTINTVPFFARRGFTAVFAVVLQL